MRLQHGPLRALHGFLAAPARIGAASASTGGTRKKMRARHSPYTRVPVPLDRARPRRFLATLAGLMAPKLSRTPRSLRARQNQDPGGTRKDKKLPVPGLKEHSNPQVKGALHKTTTWKKTPGTLFQQCLLA
ncbi:hypothetical protein NDU88_007815 [Pleurodeles waltl]|uniref:Uncharacterized protein n=1 Tax=Pleurodeles waltl TaxID=8319 RepID=A0AAV7U2C0_PLEWA|nr:hypothetical protein NDU88_007815 [Pleurodeles waltl]